MKHVWKFKNKCFELYYKNTANKTHLTVKLPRPKDCTIHWASIHLEQSFRMGTVRLHTGFYTFNIKYMLIHVSTTSLVQKLQKPQQDLSCSLSHELTNYKKNHQTTTKKQSSKQKHLQRKKEKTWEVGRRWWRQLLRPTWMMETGNAGAGQSGADFPRQRTRIQGLHRIVPKQTTILTCVYECVEGSFVCIRKSKFVWVRRAREGVKELSCGYFMIVMSKWALRKYNRKPY